MYLSEPKMAEWQARFVTHRRRIQRLLPTATLEHIGSTALPNIVAKDVVDVLVGVQANQIQAAAQSLGEVGYVLEGQREEHHWLCWPQPDKREAVIHVVLLGGEIWHKRLFFRDHLRQNPAEARAYEALKLRIAAQTDDWGEYTAQKAEFVARILAQGRLT